MYIYDIEMEVEEMGLFLSKSVFCYYMCLGSVPVLQIRITSLGLYLFAAF